jgi:5-formyltetrahydrofolate cyclo-ligase
VQSKETLRRKIKAALKTISGECFFDGGRELAHYISCLPAWSECISVLAFLSLKDELDTEPVIKAAFFEGKAVFVPRIEGENLNFYRISSLDGPWALNSWKIREPLPLAAGLLCWEYFPALVLTPGLAFTRDGKRLGRGRGFYDRFFAYLDGAGRYFALGLCITAQLVPDIPVDDRDRQVHGVCTEKGILLVCPS